MSESRYYYVNSYTKIVQHSALRLDPTPDGFEFTGMSQMPIKGAAGYYTKNQSGFEITDVDAQADPVKETANGI